MTQKKKQIHFELIWPANDERRRGDQTGTKWDMDVEKRSKEEKKK